MRHRTAGRRVTKAEWYSKGGFANSRLYRIQSANGAWRYYELPES